jgi:hypothetical protein
LIFGADHRPDAAEGGGQAFGDYGQNGAFAGPMSEGDGRGVVTADGQGVVVTNLPSDDDVT